MKVSELIEELKKLDQNAPVFLQVRSAGYATEAGTWLEDDPAPADHVFQGGSDDRATVYIEQRGY